MERRSDGYTVTRNAVMTFFFFLFVFSSVVKEIEVSENDLGYREYTLAFHHFSLLSVLLLQALASYKLFPSSDISFAYISRLPCGCLLMERYRRGSSAFFSGERGKKETVSWSRI